jgi:molecular chaperone GrpE
MVLKLFQDTSERMGINRVTTVGQRFDPQLHEAIQQKETDEFPPGTIITEVVPGYLVGQRLLRAAMVVVARKPAPPPPPPETKSSDAEGAPPTPAATNGDSGSDGTPA